MVEEIVRNELKSIKEELEILEESIHLRMEVKTSNTQKSYAAAAAKKKKESIIIVKPKKHKENEDTRKQVKDRIDITNMAVGITKLRKRNNGTLIMGCDSASGMEKLKATVQDKMGSDYDIKEPRGIKPKMKVINIGEEEMALEEGSLIEIIMKQNKIDGTKEGFYMKLIKKITKEGSKEHRQLRRGMINGSLLLEMDEETHELILRREKINIGWKKCLVLNYFDVKRCFKCWSFYHIAKNCTRQEICHKCAGEHKISECKTTKRRCVNCMHKMKTYNLRISDEHDALSKDCPTYLKTIEEAKKRIVGDLE
ncbi:hypothetical protein DMN91_002222 [Ooceraea biroi]|uniref:CCHC-type domain-containing protein n=1 Tax=Ooceraea biroi TaxID=2015173 RepID=A0A3L8E1J2_OOCBI|nr:hypothetical protein DMN91_002222 [Ooceraea biroi]